MPNSFYATFTKLPILRGHQYGSKFFITSCPIAVCKVFGLKDDDMIK
jgi:hypothetical protein